MKEHYPGLPEVIREVQLQLEEAQKQRIAEGRRKFLQLKQLDFEMKCVLLESTESKGKFDLKVVGLDADHKIESQYCHTIRVTFEGVDIAEGEEKCPECGGLITFTEGFLLCTECGYSQCD